MNLSFKKILSIKELRNSILFVLAMLVLYRFVAHIPVPGIDTSQLADFFNSNQFFGILNVFSGGTLQNLSVAALGVAPYITASIIFQLLAIIVPKVEEMQKEGESGRQKINQWTRYLTVPLAVIQAYGLLVLFSSSGGGFLTLTSQQMIFAIIVMTGGTMFLTWIGELISEKNIGNGISIMIFASILSGLPTFVQQSLATFDSTQILMMVLFIAVTLITVIGVVIINEGTRNIPVAYAKQQRGGQSFGGAASHLPLRVNMAGVIPIIFAISIVLFPTMIAQFFVQAKTQWVADFANWIIVTMQNQLIYGIIYFVLVFAFTYFYTAVIYQPEQMAENLQKQGGFVPGMRPGSQTAEYLKVVMNRILLVGATFLSLIAVLPLLMQFVTGSQSLIIGGTSILIVVAVLIEVIKQIEAQITTREYEAL